MSFGTPIGLPLSAPNLIPTVKSHRDYLTRGYVWGHNAGVHYCFMDPGKVRWDVWEKRFHPSHLAFLLANIGAAALFAWWGNFPVAAALFFSIPSLPLVLLDHYASTAQEQAAAVVTNGPQMQYPFGLSTAGMIAAGEASRRSAASSRASSCRMRA